MSGELNDLSPFLAMPEEHIQASQTSGQETVGPWPITCGRHNLLQLVRNACQYVWKRPWGYQHS